MPNEIAESPLLKQVVYPSFAKPGFAVATFEATPGMKILLLHPEDKFPPSGPAGDWDLVVDPGRACIIEKHITLSRSLEGPDSAFSLEPREFKAMVEAVRTTEKALGEIHFGSGAHEESSRVFRRSLFLVDSIRHGEAFTAKNIRSIRPGHGLHTRYLPQIIGKRASRDIERGTPLSWDLIEDQRG